VIDVPAPIGMLALAWLLDARIGEPPAIVHPVVWMGRAIAPLKRIQLASRAAELVLGALYATLVIVGFAFVAGLSLYFTQRWPVAHFSIAVFWLWCCFALRGLVRAGTTLRTVLESKDLTLARRALGSLCSRDAGALSETELAGAGIESLSENSSDSVVAPLFYFVLFGVPGVVAYRVVNTLDAMVGYRGRYEWLGKFSARLDDVLNFIPARITALLLLLAGWTLGRDVAGGVRVWWRDARATESPNAGQPMAVAAGLLSVRLDKRDAYVLGADRGVPDARALRAAEELVRVTGLLAFGGAALAIACLGGEHVFTF